MALDQLVGKANVEPKSVSLTAVSKGPVPERVEDWVALSEQNNPNVKQSRISSDVAKLETQKRNPR